MTVTVAELAPIASDDEATTFEDLPVTIPVLVNDNDPEGDAVEVVSVVQPTNGSVVINVDGTITYTPNPEFSGVDTFTYQICEVAPAAVGLTSHSVLADALCDTAQVTVTVVAVDDPPVWNGSSPTLVGSVGVAMPPLPIVDPEGTTVTITLVGGTLPPGVTLNPDGTFGGTAEAVGTYVFDIEACDTGGICSIITVVVQIVDLALTDDDPPLSGDALPLTGLASMDWMLVALALMLVGAVAVRFGDRRESEAG